MTATRRYVFKLYPSSGQAEILHMQRAMMADLWNAAKQRIEDTYRRERRMLSYYDLTNEITGLRHECPEWAAIPAVTAHRVVKCLTDAYRAFFRRLRAGEPEAGYPGWRRRDRETTIPLGTMLTTGWRIEQRNDNPLSWLLHYGGVSDVRDRATWVHARGKLPTGSPDQRETPLQKSLRRKRVAAALAPEHWRNADIIWRDGNWWLSVCVDLEPRRAPGKRPVTVTFDLIDCLAYVDGVPETPQEFRALASLAESLDRSKSERDRRWPRGKRRNPEDEEAYRETAEGISALSAHMARLRRHALHVWTARIVRRASALTIIKPPSIREATASGRGNVRDWGANVETVSMLNRAVLSAAPAMAIAMLEYKAAEAGIRCEIISDPAPSVSIGAKVAAAGKTLRRVRRELRKAAA